MPYISAKISTITDIAKLVGGFEKALARLRDRSAALIRALRHRAQINHLAELDDRALADIGLTRGDVIASLEQPMACDPSLELVARRASRRDARSALRREVSALLSDPTDR